jgi:hypothetical protein
VTDSRFTADPRKILTRWRQVRRRRKLDPAAKARDKVWGERMKKLRRAEPAITEAGFMEAAHYFPGGVPSYCMCGTVQDHNQRFDKLVEGANGRS